MPPIRRWPGLVAVLALWTGTAHAETATTPSATPGASAPTADKRTGLAGWEALKGNTITGRSASATYSEYFDPAGAVRLVDADGLSTGTWTVQNNKVCFDFPDDDEHSCTAFEVTGTSGTATEDDGSVLRFDILPGNSKGL